MREEARKPQSILPRIEEKIALVVDFARILRDGAEGGRRCTSATWRAQHNSGVAVGKLS